MDNMNNIYKCDTCGEYFTQNEIYIIHEKGCYEADYGVASDFDHLTYYDNTIGACPFCRGISFKKGSICKICEKFIPYDLSDVDNICDDCYYDNINKSGE